MGRRAQVIAGWDRQVFAWFSLFMAVTLAGCGTYGFSIEDAVPDRSILTGSITPGSIAQQDGVEVDSFAASDEETIRNAVSSAIVEQVNDGGVGWANASTGSRGAINQIVEKREGPRICRRFTASRESFDGVHLYRGEACLGSGRVWTMTAFARVE